MPATPLQPDPRRGDPLTQVFATVHPAPERLRIDWGLRAVLLGLYADVSVQDVWSSVLKNYFLMHAEALRKVLAEHAVDPSWSLLDSPEVLLLLERADNDREHLRRVWPGPDSALARLSDVWGVPL